MSLSLPGITGLRARQQEPHQGDEDVQEVGLDAPALNPAQPVERRASQPDRPEPARDRGPCRGRGSWKWPFAGNSPRGPCPGRSAASAQPNIPTSIWANDEDVYCIRAVGAANPQSQVPTPAAGRAASCASEPRAERDGHCGEQTSDDRDGTERRERRRARDRACHLGAQAATARSSTGATTSGPSPMKAQSSARTPIGPASSSSPRVPRAVASDRGIRGTRRRRPSRSRPPPARR